MGIQYPLNSKESIKIVTLIQEKIQPLEAEN